MGWKGTLRSVNAAVRAAERNSQRRRRELARQEKELAKLEAIDQAAHEVTVYQNYLSLITSVHMERSEIVDWDAMSQLSEPKEPSRCRNSEEEARYALEHYSPGFFVRLFGREASRRNALSRAVKVGIESDQDAFNAEMAAFKSAHVDWKQSTEVARRVLSGDGTALLEAIEHLDPFTDITGLGSNLTFQSPGSGIVEAELHVHGDEVIPAESKSQLQSGKLSVKKMPKGMFNELYQDYVCSCAIRVAAELQAILPIRAAVVTATDELLNSATGHIERMPILSVLVPRESLEKLNLEKIDPSDSMRNFVHNMDFKKTLGFRPVQKVSFDQSAL